VVTAPFNWVFTQTTGPEKNNTSVFDTNSGPTQNVELASASLGGEFVFDAIHTPPENCGMIDALPTMVSFKMVGVLDGSYSDSTINLTIGGVGIEGFTKVSGSIDQIGNFIGINDLSPGFSNIDETISKTFSVFDGKMLPYTGDVNTNLTFGFGGQNLDFQTVFAQLKVSGEFLGETNFNIRYLQEVPEPPTTALLALGLLGMGLRFRKSRPDRRKNALISSARWYCELCKGRLLACKVLQADSSRHRST
jgi:hypothetical protein